MPQPPLTTDWREWSRFMQNQTAGMNSLTSALNVGPMRELIPQVGPIRRTDAITGYQIIGGNSIYIPFLLSADFWDVNGFYTVCDTFGNGNICLGIYSEAGTRLATTGSVATVNEISIAISPVVRLTRNRYYLGVAMSTAIDTIACYAGTTFGDDLVRMKQSGIKAQLSTFPLPATATFGNPIVAFVPAVYVGIAAPS